MLASLTLNVFTVAVESVGVVWANVEVNGALCLVILLVCANICSGRKSLHLSMLRVQRHYELGVLQDHLRFSLTRVASKCTQNLLQVHLAVQVTTQ